MIDTDTVVIGAGPAGLYQAFQLGLLGLRVVLVDALPHAGGQVVELYGDKPIYDIPALPVCTGHELVARLLEQLQPLQPGQHFGHAVQTLQPTTDGRWLVGTAQHTFNAGAVVIAAGVGAFEPRRLKLTGIEAFEGTQVFHRRQPAVRFAGQRLVIVGGDEAALEQAIACAEAAHDLSHPVTLVHRRRVFQAPEALVQRFDTLCDAGTLQFIAGQPSGLDIADDGRLQALQLLNPDGATVTLPLDTLQVMLGLSPKLGPVTEWGLALERKQLVVDPATGATSQPGIYAIGDVVHYPGKKRLIACAFHEATMAAHAVLAHLHPGQAGPLLYTSSSALLQQRLGVVATPQRD